MTESLKIYPVLKKPDLIRLAITIWIFFLLSQNVFSQSPYSLSVKKDLPILVSEAALFTINIPLNKKFRSLSPEDTIGLDILNLPAIDRKVVYNWSEKAQKKSDFLLQSSHFVPLALPLLAGKNSRQDVGVTYTIILEGMLATFTVTELTKFLAKRKRPYVYGRSDFNGDPFNKNALKSFFSGHTSTTAVNYYLGAKMFNDFYPDSKWRPVVWGTAAIVPAITAWKRVQGGKHFVTDVVAGYVVGALAGILIPELHRVH